MECLRDAIESYFYLYGDKLITRDLIDVAEYSKRLSHANARIAQLATKFEKDNIDLETKEMRAKVKSALRSAKKSDDPVSFAAIMRANIAPLGGLFDALIARKNLSFISIKP